MKKVFEAIKISCGLIKNNPYIILPFFLFALLEGIVLYLLFMAPQEPFSQMLSPPIARIWGEKFVHYPWHLLKLPQLFNSAGIVLSLLPGIFVSAIVVGLAGDMKTGQLPKFRRHIKTCLKRFFSLIVIWILGFAVLKIIKFVCDMATGWGESESYLTALQYSAYFLVFWARKAVFLYAVPLVVLEKQSLFKALLMNFRYFKRLFLPTFLCIFLASLLYLGIYFFEKDILDIAARTSPEMIVVILAAGIPFKFVINLFITIISTVLFVDEQANDPQVSLTASRTNS
jgi:hypothetical protein